MCIRAHCATWQRRGTILSLAEAAGRWLLAGQDNGIHGLTTGPPIRFVRPFTKRNFCETFRCFCYESMDERRTKSGGELARTDRWPMIGLVRCSGTQEVGLFTVRVEWRALYFVLTSSWRGRGHTRRDQLRARARPPTAAVRGAECRFGDRHSRRREPAFGTRSCGA